MNFLQSDLFKWILGSIFLALTSFLIWKHGRGEKLGYMDNVEGFGKTIRSPSWHEFIIPNGRLQGILYTERVRPYLSPYKSIEEIAWLSLAPVVAAVIIAAVISFDATTFLARAYMCVIIVLCEFFSEFFYYLFDAIPPLDPSEGLPTPGLNDFRTTYPCNNTMRCKIKWIFISVFIYAANSIAFFLLGKDVAKLLL